ncbi:MFS transporter [Edaphobacter bradus]|uniref:MFS transporter n=1 Tax=Edaphobacter bradus TaxID=2259016 RepID=UPI0021E07124|nr:MFS transporter [Edaphobacter bradus]
MNAPARDIEKIAHVPHEVAALLSALRLSDPDLAPLRRLSDDEWKSLLAFCDIAHLALPLAQLSMDGFPCWVVERLQTNLADNAQRFERIKDVYREAAEALHGSGVEHIVIKGFTQAPNYVASPRLRSQSDLDLFCPPGQVAAAQAALEAIGYSSAQSPRDGRADHVPALVRPGKWEWKGNPYDPEMPLGIDLHFYLWNEPAALFSVPVNGFWERRVTRAVEGLTFSALHPVDQLGYLALHILRNILRGDWIIHLVRELAVFLHAHASDDVFWAKWAEMHDASLRAFEGIAFYYARDWFGCELHLQAENAIASLHPSQLQWLNRFSSTGLENMFRQNKDAVWLHMTFLSSARERGTILKRAFFPAQISSVDSPAVQTRNKRRVQSNGNHRWLQYIAYLGARSNTYARADLSALWRGFQWWFSRHQLSPQFLLFLASSFFFNLGLSIYFFLFNLFLISNGYTERNLGLITSAMAAGSLAGAIPAGRLVQRIGLRPVLLTCFCSAIAISSMRALLLSFTAQLALAFLAGFTLSAWAVCLSPAVAQLTSEKQRPTAFSLLFAVGIGLGAVGGMAGSRLPDWFTQHHLFLHSRQPAQIVLLLSCGIVALGIWPATRLRFVRATATQRLRPALSPFLLRYLPAIFVWSLVTGSFSPLANVYFARHLHMTMHQIGNAFSISQVVQIAAVLAAPILFRRWGLITGIVSTQIAASLVLLILASISHPLAATAAYAVFCAFQWMNEPCLYSLLMNMVPSEERGGASASNSLAISTSQIIAAALAGQAFARYGYPSVLRAIALFALLAATLFWNLQKTPHRKSVPVLDDIPG